MAKKPYDYYWTDAQRAEVAEYIKELDEALATYDDKKKEFLAARKRFLHIYFSSAFKPFRTWKQEVQADLVNLLNVKFACEIEKYDRDFFTEIKIEP